jgi:hypothetical protein
VLVGLASLTVVAAGFLTPGYDPMSRTVSRLAVDGAPAAPAVEVAIAAVALAYLGLAAATRPGRIPLTLAGMGFLGAAAFHLETSTVAHRVASGIAVAAVVSAAFALRGYGRMSVALGVAELATLAAGLALLATPFTAWGAWERTLLGLAVAWTVLIAARIVWSDEAARTAVASASKRGT